VTRLVTHEQQQLALSLLREALDWIGMVDLTDAEEERATEVQCRIEQLLVELGDRPSGFGMRFVRLPEIAGGCEI